MRVYQQTIANKISLSGVGLHSGIVSEIHLLPAIENHGIRFQRIDLPDRPVIGANVELVSEVTRGTTLSKDGISIHTVEHLLAAAVGLQIDNLLIQIDGPEVPILDGSALPFVLSMKAAKIKSQKAQVDYFEITEPIAYHDSKTGVTIHAEPCEEYSVSVSVNYQSPVLGKQQATLSSINSFESEIAPSRTFCFFHELEQLHQMGLIQGGDLSNAVVVVDRPIAPEEMNYLATLLQKEKLNTFDVGILNKEKLRFANEPARHKLLDVIGDLSLVGKPVRGKIFIEKPGHSANVAFARHLKKLIHENAFTS